MSKNTRDGESHASLLTALRHPLRRSILRHMAALDRPASPREISSDLDESLSNVSYHIRTLADNGAVKLVETQPVSGSVQHFYRMTVKEPWALAVLGLTDDADDKG